MKTVKQIIGLVGDVLKGKPARARSPKWSTARKEHLKKNPTCVACGSAKSLNVHHVIPFNRDPGKELDPENLVTLCEDRAQNCHFVFGHLGESWHAWNDHVRDDAALHLSRIHEWRLQNPKKGNVAT